MQRVPYLAIIGEKELESRTVSLRTQKGEDLGLFNLPDLIQKLDDESTGRAVNH